ncbi:unnamed protein product [Heterobilharzia americana]|nr:unnamed protein product [Heterobilharzia americana]
MEQKFVSIGRSLVTVVPINANMSIINNVGIIDIPSVYVNSTSEKYDKKLIISYVIKIIDATKFSAKLDVNVGVYVVTSRVNLSPIPASSPAQLAKAQIPYWAIGTLATSRSNTSLMLGAFNLLSFNIVIQPQARQSYKIQVYILQLLNIVTLMEPKILDVGSAVCTFDFQTTVSATNLEINMGPQYFESNETMTNSRSEKSAINFLVPLNVNLLASSFVTVRFTLFYGTQNVQTYVNVNVLKNEARVPSSSLSYQVDAASFHERPSERKYPAVPGQVVRFHYIISLPNTMCARFQIMFSLSSNSWAVDMLGATVLSYSEYIWFSSGVNPIIDTFDGIVAVDMGTICVPETFDNQIRLDLFVRPQINFVSSVSGNKTVLIVGELSVSTIGSLYLPVGSFVVNPEYTMEESMVKVAAIPDDSYKPKVRITPTGSLFLLGTWRRIALMSKSLSLLICLIHPSLLEELMIALKRYQFSL